MLTFLNDSVPFGVIAIRRSQSFRVPKKGKVVLDREPRSGRTLYTPEVNIRLRV